MSALTRTATVACLTVVLLAGLALGGCGRVAERAAEEAVEQATGVEVDQDQESVTIETDEGGATISASDEIPQGFPTDFPIYDNGTIIGSSSMSSGEGEVFTVTIETDDSADQVVAFYEAELPDAGWEVQGTTSMSQGGQNAASIVATKGGPEGTQGSVGVTEESGGTEIAIVITTTP